MAARGRVVAGGDGCVVSAAPEPTVRAEFDIPYVFMAAPTTRTRRSFDLFIPNHAKRPPLVVFVHGGFWVEPNDRFRMVAMLPGH